MKKVTRKDLIILAVILTGFSIVVLPRFLFHTQETAKESYYCPMHPTYTSDRPGDCPICNMKLVPRPGEKAKKEHKILYYRHPMGQPDISPVPKKDAMGMDYIPVYEDEAAGAPSKVPGHATVQIPVEKQQLIGVRLGTVEKRRLTQKIRTSGRVAYDPELFTAQQEFISAVEGVKRAQEGSYPEPKERAEALVEAARTRLRLLGMSDSEIGELEKGAPQDRNLILPALSALVSSAQQFVWVYGNLYEYEIPAVKMGTPVKVEAPTFPDKIFSGEVRSARPNLDAATRSIQVRARVENPEGLLRPEMYVDLSVEIDRGEVLALPEEAVMLTGERAIVFVAQGEGSFEPREVKLGAKAENFYEVKEGLQDGEKVAVSGNFLIDSESRLKGALQRINTGEAHVH